jgi:type 1 glutamine amidotransferase
VQVSDQAHPILSGVQDFDVLDEVYGGLEIDAHCQVLMHARAEDGPWMPCWWVHQYGPARVCYDALGHDERSLSAASHQLALEQSIAWLLGRTTAQTY